MTDVIISREGRNISRFGTGPNRAVTGGRISGAPFFEDDFVGTQKNNAGGFVWSGTGSTVTVQSFDGHNALRFRYGPDAPLGQSSAEQRFNMGRNITELWIEYYLWVPANYAHRYQEGQAANNKFIRFWGNSYDASNKVGASSLIASPSYVRYEATNKAWGGSGTGFLDGGSPTEAAYGTAGMLDAWTQVRMRFSIVSALDADDAEFDLWFDGVKLASQSGMPQQYTDGQNYWNNGYLMGWANSGYAAETDFYIRNIKFYDTDPGWT